MTIIRPYQPDDRPGLEACFTALQDYEHTLDPYTVPAAGIVAPYIDRLLTTCAEQRGRIYMAEIDGRIAGFAALFVEEDDDLATSLKQYMYLSDVVVLPEFRRYGVGLALLEQAEAYAREAGFAELVLNVLANNATALAFYQRAGYSEFFRKMIKKLDQP